MAAGFGDIITESLADLRPHNIRPAVMRLWVGINCRVLQFFFQQRINVFTVPFQFQEPGKMINARYQI